MAYRSRSSQGEELFGTGPVRFLADEAGSSAGSATATATVAAVGLASGAGAIGISVLAGGEGGVGGSAAGRGGVFSAGAATSSAEGFSSGEDLQAETTSSRRQLQAVMRLGVPTAAAYDRLQGLASGARTAAFATSGSRTARLRIERERGSTKPETDPGNIPRKQTPETDR